MANEGTAKYFFHEEGVPNIGFRPLTMFGVGREIGLTSDTTKAIKAAILGRYFDIGFWGPTVFNFCPDIADLFIKACKLSLDITFFLSTFGVDIFILLLTPMISLFTFHFIFDEVPPWRRIQARTLPI